MTDDDDLLPEDWEERLHDLVATFAAQALGDGGDWPTVGILDTLDETCVKAAWRVRDAERLAATRDLAVLAAMLCRRKLSGSLGVDPRIDG